MGRFRAVQKLVNQARMHGSGSVHCSGGNVSQGVEPCSAVLVVNKCGAEPSWYCPTIAEVEAWMARNSWPFYVAQFENDTLIVRGAIPCNESPKTPSTS